MLTVQQGGDFRCLSLPGRYLVIPGRNTVPVAAPVCNDDVFVARELSLETAERVRGLSVYETGQFHHDGIHDDGPAILRELLSRTER